MSCRVRVTAGDGELILNGVIGETVHELLTDAGVFIDAPCGGRAKCGKCLVFAHGELSTESEAEIELLAGRRGRLACMTKILGDCEVVVPGGEETISVSTEGESVDFPFSPWGRVPGLGAAIDIGTTTVVAYLFDLMTGARLGTAGELNLQRSFGADVISRISHCIKEQNGREELTELITDQIKSMLKGLCVSAGAKSTDITALSVAGNTTMTHLFSALSPKKLAAIPFTPESLFGESYIPDLSAELGISAEAEVFILPAVSGFVGGDITGAALAAGLDRGRETALLIDIGTNGEMVLACENRIFCCATAAGPAFEGADITCGMGGAEGAVDKVWLSQGEIKYEVIGQAPIGSASIGVAPSGAAPDTAWPKGICGSGLIDALSLMLSLGAVDETGRLLPDDEAEPSAKPFLFETNSGETAFKIAPNVYITGRDVRKLQLAKAAVAAGVRTLLDEAGLSFERVEKMYIAGGFGNHIEPAAAGKIGLYPIELTDRCVSIGNAAGMGAAAVLCSSEARAAVTQLRDRMKYVELSTDPRFMNHYVEQMMF